MTQSLIAATVLIVAHSYSLLSFIDAWQPQTHFQSNVLNRANFPSSKLCHSSSSSSCRRIMTAWSPSSSSSSPHSPLVTTRQKQQQQQQQDQQQRFSHHRLYVGKWSSNSHNTETARTTRTSRDGNNDEDEGGETNDTFFFNPPNWFSSLTDTGSEDDSDSSSNSNNNQNVIGGAFTRGKVLGHFDEGDDDDVDDDNISEMSSSFFAFPTLPSFQQQTTNSECGTVETKNTSDGGDTSTSAVSTDSTNESTIVAAAIVGVMTIIVATALGGGLPVTGDSDLSGVITQVQAAVQDPGAALEAVVDTVDSMGPLGVAYFGIAYTIAEIFAIPAIPLTASAGYLFGPVQGTGIVLFSAAIAAAISFGIGRTLLRDYVEGILVDYPKFAKIDKAIGKEGFKLMLLLRLSPIFPFALSNYLYGASSINFPAFFWGTVLGFAPGTIAYVYTGYVGKALTDGGTEAYPWYVYGLGLTLFGGLLKIIADVATRIVEEIEDEEG